MFETKQTTSNGETIVPAAVGYSVLYFDPPLEMKPHMVALLELVPRQTYPVVAFRLRNGKADPISIASPPDGALRYFFVGTKIYSLDSDEVWSALDQWQQSLLSRWRGSQKEPAVPPPSQLQMKPGDTAVIMGRGFF